MKLQSTDPSFSSSFTQIFYGRYEILALESIHLAFVYDHTTTMIYYLALTPSEYTILLRLVQEPAGEIVPFEALLPASSRKKVSLVAPYPGLQRHMNRLRKKLPPVWRLVCKPGAGYRLQMVAPLKEPQKTIASPSSLQAG
ncbi:helix-turn-helix domain-containing protein [Reticulibacter mediterranei]|nr:helix-turn-helix domain-containing protein [Reticulibacter mediterranei]